MATAESNYQLANLIAAPMRESVGRYLDAQVQIAERAARERQQRELMNLKRLQEIEDQQAETKLRTDLANLTAATHRENTAANVEGQLRLENLRADRETDRLTAADRKALAANIRSAFATYRAAGGEKKLSDFGREDDPETFYRIQGDHGEVTRRQQSEQFSALANELRERERALAAMTDVGEDELAGLAVQSANGLAFTNPKHADAAEFFSKASGKLGRDGAMRALRVKYPAFAGELEAATAMAVRTTREGKAKSPEFLRALQSYQSDRAAITEAALKSPYGTAFLNNLRPQSKAEAIPTGRAPTRATLDNLVLPATTGDQGAPVTATGAAFDAGRIRNLFAPAIIAQEQGPAALASLLNPVGASIAIARQLAPRLARRTPVALSEADRLASSLATSVYNLRPIGVDRGYFTRAGEAVGESLGRAVDANAFVTPAQ